MKQTYLWREEDRSFLRLVSEAAFCNPFSEQRETLNQQLAGKGPAKSAIDRAISGVRDRLAELERAGASTARAATEEDREWVRHACLFDTFHQYLAHFDRLILDQIKSGDAPCPVPFSTEVLDQLERRGFSRPEALRVFAMFYQMRRAFYFITSNLVGASASTRRLRIQLWNNIFTHDTRLYVRHLWNRMEDFSTLLLGETGTGKGAAASAIGRSGYIPFDEQTRRFSESFSRTFVDINLSQFPSTLIESELFGHKKGAFTGALNPHEGLFARCSPHGAIFLDEIGEISTPIQIKLLQVLQDRVFSPVGSHEKRRFSGRVIAATNQDLEEKRRQGQFRDDFYYRLCSDVIHVPPLRQRLVEEPGELGHLVEHLVKRLAGEESDELIRLVNSALERQPGPRYPWPGNVRELEQAVRRILLTHVYSGDSRQIGADEQSRLMAGLSAGTLTADELLAGYCRQLFQQHGTYEEVARRTGLDRRTVKKHITRAWTS